MAEIVDLNWDDESEDQFKRSFDFTRPDGSPIDNLDELEQDTGRPAANLAHDLLHLPFGRSAPQRLIEEALEYARR